MHGFEFAAAATAQRLRAWWDGQHTGVNLSAATLLIVETEELAGLGRAAYVAVPPGPRVIRPYPHGADVTEVPANTVHELVDVVAGALGAGRRGEPSKSAQSAYSLPHPDWHMKGLWDGRLVRTAMVTGALGVGAWLLSAAMPAQAQADDGGHRYQHEQRQSREVSPEKRAEFKQALRDAVTERLRESGVDSDELFDRHKRSQDRPPRSAAPAPKAPERVEEAPAPAPPPPPRRDAAPPPPRRRNARSARSRRDKTRDRRPNGVRSGTKGRPTPSPARRIPLNRPVPPLRPRGRPPYRGLPTGAGACRQRTCRRRFSRTARTVPRGKGRAPTGAEGSPLRLRPRLPPRLKPPTTPKPMEPIWPM
ncbi:hypothetical protein [Streptomyces camponoticapitis]|nr:hypothetical protein [Streptomyces camponoticapitis]